MADRKYLYTERAHYMCPNMHFGILAEIDVEQADSWAARCSGMKNGTDIASRTLVELTAMS